VKTQGSYALEATATATTSLNTSLTKTIASPLNLSGYKQVQFDLRSSRTGSNIKFGLHDTSGTTTEFTPNVTTVSTYKTYTWDLSGVSNANKDAIDRIIITVVNADNSNSFFVDNILDGYTAVATLTNPPVLNAFSSFTNDQTPPISNSSTPDLSFAGRQVKLYSGASLLATTTANGSGVFTFADGDFSTPLTEGAHTPLQIH
jgi:hypothetical protein